MAKAWVGRTWPTPRRVGFGDWQLGLPLPTMCGLPTQVWHTPPSQKAQFAPEGKKPKDIATFPPGCVISSKSLNLSRSQFPSLYWEWAPWPGRISEVQRSVGWRHLPLRWASGGACWPCQDCSRPAFPSSKEDGRRGTGNGSLG